MKTEYTANLALQRTPATVTIGRTFHAPAPRRPSYRAPSGMLSTLCTLALSVIFAFVGQ